ncbi:MAG: hypothetical protein LQ347_004175 [Umbilicaria vellea]|nr:MAG: hypothetical protein LQ347_004175 [Umbilicaria vellea]
MLPESSSITVVISVSNLIFERSSARCRLGFQWPTPDQNFQRHDPADSRFSVGRAHSTLLPTSLRIPLSWLHSTTYAFYPDESHSSIRRVFTPQHAPQTKRQFCGFCGTTLTHWSEERAEEADLVDVNVESLDQSSLSRLGEGLWEGVLPVERKQDELGAAVMTSEELTGTSQGRELTGAPWFEEMVEGSALGRIRRRRGGEASQNGRIRVEWEVVEFDGAEDDGGSGAAGVAKRKIGDLGDGDDILMRGGGRG